MFRKFSKRWLEVVTVALLLPVACGGSGSTGGPAGVNTSPEASPTTGSGSVSIGKAVSIHVTLTGGPTPGSWDVSGQQPCRYVHDQNGTEWGVEFSNPDQSTTQLAYVAVGYFAEGPNANKFTVQAQVGASSAPYVATTLAGAEAVGGSGTMAVQDGGATARYSVDAQTKEGYAIKATVQCSKVARVST